MDQGRSRVGVLLDIDADSMLPLTGWLPPTHDSISTTTQQLAGFLQRYPLAQPAQEDQDQKAEGVWYHLYTADWWACQHSGCLWKWQSNVWSHVAQPSPYAKHLFVELKRRCRVRLALEFWSSKLCSCCHKELLQTRHWQVKKCLNPLCLTSWWNCDINAARIIWYVFLYRNSHGGVMLWTFVRD